MIENKVRIHLALGLQCFGYAKFYQRVFEQTGIQEGIFTNHYIGTEDRSMLGNNSTKGRRQCEDQTDEKTFQKTESRKTKVGKQK
jgi:hypothetical protein